MLDLIVLVLFLLFSWTMILSSHMAAAKMKDKDAPGACSAIVALIITIIGAFIL